MIGRLERDLLNPGGTSEGELLFPRRKVGRRAFSSREEILKDSFCFHGDRLEGELLFPGGKVVGMRASVYREEGWKESFFFQRGNLERELLLRKEV
jgi:hypothetical protein